MTLHTDQSLHEVDRLMHALAGRDFLGRIAAEQLAGGGRRTRAHLALAAGRALCVPNAVAWAAACELLHNATLVHDDLQDGDRVRRGRPTAWAAYGSAHAINAGDLLLMLPLQAIHQQAATATQRNALVAALATRAVASVRGQADDLELPHGDWSFSAWEKAAHGKSGQLLALPVEGAAILADRPDYRSCGDVFAQAGVLYQLVDDLVDLYGDKGRGEVGNDIREGKISALVTRHVERRPQDRPWLKHVLATQRDRTTRQDIARVARRFEASGAVGAVQTDIQARLTELASDTVPEALRPIATQVALRCTRDLETLK